MGKFCALLVALMVVLPEDALASTRYLLPLSTRSLLEAISQEVLVIPAADNGGPDLRNPAAQEWLADIAQEQADFALSLRKCCPDAVVEYGFGILVNAVVVSGCTADQLASVPGHGGVHGELEFALQLDSMALTTQVRTFQALTEPPSRAGAGAVVALFDSGIDESHFFIDPAGITVTRTFFRPGDPVDPTTDVAGGDDGMGHGTHLAGIIAGRADTPAFINGYDLQFSGMAPGASLLNYKLFYRAISGAITAMEAEVIAALEWAVRDGAHVAVLPFGATPPVAGTICSRALDAAATAGILVVTAAGNGGDVPGSILFPGLMESPLTVGAIDTGRVFAVAVNVSSSSTTLPGYTDIIGIPPEDGPPLPLEMGPIPFVSGQAVLPDQNRGCEPFDEDLFTGAVALLSTGGCADALKVQHAANAGAAAVIFYQSIEGMPAVVMAGESFAIPAVQVGNAEGRLLEDWLSDWPDTMLVLRRDAIITRVPSIYGWVSPFSARGPTDDALLKPDMIAPGERVLSSSNGEEPWVFASGTSVSTAHVAGAAALLRAQFPEWTPSRLKDALVSGAKADFRFAPYFSAFEKGAGTLLLAWLAQWPGFASPSSLSLGEALPGSTLEGEFDLTQFDLSGIESPETAFSLTFDQEDTFRSHEVAFVPSDEEGRAVVRFSVTTDVQSPVGDFSGAVSAWRGEQRITLPFAYRTVPPIGEEVLLLDLTFSSPPDAARIGFYQQLVLNAGAIPDLRIAGVDAISASDLLPFRAIVAFTGDDQAHMDTRVADAVLHALSAYVQRGGALLLAGQGALAGSHHPRIFHCLGAAPDADVSAFVSDAPVQANGAIPGAPAEPFLLRGATAPPTADLSVVHTWRYLMSSGSPVPLGMPLFQTIETGGGGALLGVLFDPYRYYSRHPALWKTRGRSAAMGFGFEAIADGERAQSLFTWLLNWLQERLELALDVERYADGYTVIHARVTGANGVSFEYRFNEDEFTVRSASAQIGYVFDETKDNRVTVLVWSAKGAAAVATADIPASGDETDDGRDDSDGEGTDIPGRVDVPVDERIVRVRDCSCNMVGEGIGRTLLRLLR